MKEKKTQKVVFALFMAGMLSGQTVTAHAAVITSNATDKTAVVFDEHTAYSAGDYTLYDGELYICVNDIQGAWDTAKAHFLQVTKNHELGQGDELSADYPGKKDPSDEKSLMSFIANAWQKLRDYFGTSDKSAATDKENYTDATVSAKLNYLKVQNEDLETQNSRLEGQNDELKDKFEKLQEKVDGSFTSVSNGKSIMADAITDEGGTISSPATFEQFKNSILDLCQKKKEEGIQAGMEAADKRENTDSASYKKGVEDGKKQGGLKEFESEIRLLCDGPDGELKEGESFTHFFENSYIKHWNYTKTFSRGHKIRYAYVEDTKEEYGMYSASTKTALLVNDAYVLSNGNGSMGSLSVTSDTFKINDYLFNPTYASSSHTDIHIHIFYD